jgi:hypothetical protein
MRTVTIVEQRGVYKWIAIDHKTKEALLRLPDLNQLQNVCERLEWTIVDVKSIHKTFNSFTSAVAPQYLSRKQ